MKGDIGEGHAGIYSVVTKSRIQENRVHQGKFRLDLRKVFFTERVVGPWHRLAREVVAAPSLTEVKEHLCDVLSHTV